MSVWDNIFNNINDQTINFVGLFVGCAMGYYNEITEENNQQYPCFLNNFIGKKLIILVDPHLEENLKIEEYFIKKRNPLVCTKKFFKDDKLSCRIFVNNEVIIYALNESIDYIKYLWVDKEDQQDTYKIYNIIQICLERKIKFILQDFSGNDTTYFYSNLLNKYNRDDILNYINMDVTQKDGGCIILLFQDLVKLNENGNFIQEKFMELSKIKNSKLFNTILNYRIDIFIYPIIFYYSQIKSNQELEIDKIQLYKIKLFTNIYNIEYNEEIIEPIYIAEKLEILINIILKDIIIGRDLDKSFYNHIMSNIHDRKTLYETMKILKFE